MNPIFATIAYEWFLFSIFHRVVFCFLFAHPVYNLRTFSFSFSLPREVTQIWGC